MIRIRLRGLDGNVLDEKVVDKFPLTLGRNPACGMCVPDSNISGQHLELGWDGTWLSLKDLGSRNGTFVAGEKITTEKLKLPCTFRLAESIAVEIETAVPRAAGLPVAASVPRALTRPAAAPAPVVAAQPAAPVPARGEVVHDIEIVEGWERFWHQLQKFPPRLLALLLLGTGGVMFVVQVVLYRQNVVTAGAESLVAMLGSLLGGAMLALLFALPGVLFRGSFDFKPLFVQQTLCLILLSAETSVLRPAMVMDYFGFVAKLLSLPILAATCLAGSYVFIFNTFSHKNAKRLAIVSLVFAAMAFVSQGWATLTMTRNSLYRDVLTGELHASRSLAGRTTDVKAVTEEIRELGRKFPAR